MWEWWYGGGLWRVVNWLGGMVLGIVKVVRKVEYVVFEIKEGVLGKDECVLVSCCVILVEVW